MKDNANRQRSYDIHPDAALIELLGKSTKVAQDLNALAEPAKPLTVAVVNLWRYRGVAPAWRATFAKLCGIKDVELPKGWLAPNAHILARAQAKAKPETPPYLQAGE